MTDVTLSRGATSIDIQLESEAGEQLLSTSFGKPEVQVRSSGGSLQPRVQDQFSGLETYQLIGKLYDYQTTHDLADLLKSASTDPLTLDIPLPEYPDTITVAPAAGQDTAVSLGYPAGRKNMVDVELSLTRIDPNSINGSLEQQATTPTTTGSGPVEIVAGGAAVELPTADLSVERTVGRPNDVIRRQPGTSLPRYVVKPKVTSDVFTLSFETLQNIPATLNSITQNVFKQRLGRQGITLDFNGVLGLGAFDVIPIGSSPFRQVHQAGDKVVITPTLELRRILV